MALILDGTDGIGISGGTQPLDPASLNAVIQALIPTGTKMMFVQTAAPTGWTKDTTHNNKALRVVSGTASTGGTVAFTTAFASKAVSGTIANTTADGTVGSTTLTTTQIPAHTHPYHQQFYLGNGGTAFDGDALSGNGGTPNLGHFAAVPAQTTSSTGSGGSHNHSFTGTAHNHSFTGTAIDMAVQYVDVIIATKD